MAIKGFKRAGKCSLYFKQPCAYLKTGGPITGKEKD